MATIKDFSCVGGMENHIETLKETVLFPLMYGEVYSRFNIKPPRGLLFYGPPGTGKTLMAGALAFECSSAGRKVSFISRKGADCLSKWIGESEKKLQDIFLRAKQTKPCIIFFDEIDGLAPVRSSRQDFVHTSVVCTLLALMDGLDNNSEVIVIGATNRIEAIDPALRRPGRFDKELYFPLPCFNTRKQILSVHVNSWKQKPAKRFLSYLASKTIGFCGSDLQALCAEAVMCCVRRNYPQIYTSKKKHRINGRFLQRIKEARRTLPSLLYVPDITAWWELVDERARVVFASLMRGLDRTVTILILTTANCPHAELPEEIQQLYNERQGEVFEVSAPEVTERKTFFEQLFFPSGSTTSITENRSQDSSSSDVIEVPPGKRVSTEIDLRAKPSRVQSVHSTSPFVTPALPGLQRHLIEHLLLHHACILVCTHLTTSHTQTPDHITESGYPDRITDLDRSSELMTLALDRLDKIMSQAIPFELDLHQPSGTALKREYSAAGEACRASKRARMKSEARSMDEKVKPGQVLENMPSNRTTELLRRTVAVTARSNSQQLESLYALLERAIQNHKSDVYATVIRCLDNYNGSRKLKRKARKKNDYPGGKCSKKKELMVVYDKAKNPAGFPNNA
ncbi:ATPase family AAA domain-containing protein 2-like [Neodiprion pinetum]|uniref:ATPase family AAA domain-containing protein 2-like n=1 Tax=Neodiprion pinetum TaxID=441929 RepID=UPI001EDCAEA0|nr:ATPase family AAA domain-containing protein 2-like [Neodiprion pinetum]